jgi:hypothetical protein
VRRLSRGQRLLLRLRARRRRSSPLKRRHHLLRLRLPTVRVHALSFRVHRVLVQSRLALRSFRLVQ